MHPKFRPMLGAPCSDINSVKYPVIASPKYDGIRCLTLDWVPKPEHISVPVARSLKCIPNEYIYHSIGLYVPPGCDGELITYTGTQMDSFSIIQSKVMSEIGQPKFKYFLFDYMPEVDTDSTNKPYDMAYEDRIARMQDLDLPEWVSVVNVKLCHNPQELQDFHDQCIECGFEGTMFRSINSPYKFGRSTAKQGWMMKLKNFVDAEGVVIGFNELQSNRNEATVGLLGQTERSSHQANMVPMQTLGSLIVKPFSGGDNFSIGTGFTALDRQTIWDNRGSYLNKVVKFKYQEHGTKDRPRIPVFLSFRDPTDMDPMPLQQGQLPI